MSAVPNNVAITDSRDTTTLRTLSERGISYPMSRSKHQTLKSIMDGQSKREIDLMFAEQDHDAMEWVEKLRIKKDTRRERNGTRMDRKTQEV